MSKRQLEWILIAVLTFGGTYFWFHENVAGYAKHVECVRTYRTAVADIKAAMDSIDINTKPEEMGESFVKRLWDAQTRIDLLIKEPPCGKPNLVK